MSMQASTSAAHAPAAADSSASASTAVAAPASIALNEAEVKLEEADSAVDAAQKLVTARTLAVAGLVVGSCARCKLIISDVCLVFVAAARHVCVWCSPADGMFVFGVRLLHGMFVSLELKNTRAVCKPCAHMCRPSKVCAAGGVFLRPRVLACKLSPSCVCYLCDCGERPTVLSIHPPGGPSGGAAPAAAPGGYNNARRVARILWRCAMWYMPIGRMCVMLLFLRRFCPCSVKRCAVARRLCRPCLCGAHTVWRVLLRLWSFVLFWPLSAYAVVVPVVIHLHPLLYCVCGVCVNALAVMWRSLALHAGSAPCMARVLPLSASVSVICRLE